MKDKNWLLGGNRETWKTNSTVTEPNFYCCHFFPIFLMVHLQCAIVMTKRRWTYANIGNHLIPTSNISNVIGSAWVVGHTPTHSHPQTVFPLNGYFQQLSAQRGNQALDRRLKSYQLHLFLSPCYHSIHSSLLSLTNPSLPHLSPLRPQRSSASSLFSTSLSSHVAALSWSCCLAPPVILLWPRVARGVKSFASPRHTSQLLSPPHSSISPSSFSRPQPSISGRRSTQILYLGQRTNIGKVGIQNLTLSIKSKGHQYVEWPLKG